MLFDERGLSNSFVPRSNELVYFNLFEVDRNKFFSHGAFSISVLSRIYILLDVLWEEETLRKKNHGFPYGVYQGFWQDLKYVEPVLNEIRPLFDLKELKSSILEEKNNTVAIHVRGTDYLTHPTLIKLGKNYYKSAIDLITGQVDDPHFIVFTDDRARAKEVLKGINFEWTESNSGIDDFALMKGCHHQIIANSTFSWWAAMLNPYHKKVVIAPYIWENGVVNLLSHHSFKLIKNS